MNTHVRGISTGFVFFSSVLIAAINCYFVNSWGEDHGHREDASKLSTTFCDSCKMDPGCQAFGIECVHRAGSSCKPMNITKYSDTLKSLILWRKPKDGCVKNSFCSSLTRMCVCKAGYFHDSSGYCIPQRQFYQSCSEDYHCDFGLQCREGRCKCSDETIFDIRTLKCHIRLGERCSEFAGPEDIDCAPNAECSADAGCICRMGYGPSQDGSCGLEHGMPCDLDHPCADIQLSCKNGRCECRYPAHQVLYKSKCLGKVGAPCTSNHSDCVENAECVGSACRCQDPYVEDYEGGCVKAFGMACDWDEECDPVAQLSCIDGTCQCPDGLQKYDSSIRTCRGLLGSRCSVDSKYSQIRNTGLTNLCTKGAFCRTLVRGIHGRCECKTGYVSNLKDKSCQRNSSKYLKII